MIIKGVKFEGDDLREEFKDILTEDGFLEFDYVCSSCGETTFNSDIPVEGIVEGVCRHCDHFEDINIEKG
jgi:hypothetical protein